MAQTHRYVLLRESDHKEVRQNMFESRDNCGNPVIKLCEKFVL